MATDDGGCLIPIHPTLFEDLEQGATENTAPGVHCPFVVVDGGLHHIFIRRPYGTNLHLASPDVYSWPTMPEVVFEERDARDACIQRYDGLWHWYYVQHHPIDGVKRSCVMLRVSDDLDTWSDARPVFIDPRHEVRHSRLESPYVIEHGGAWWLFFRDRWREDEANPAPLVVYRSERPDFFAADVEPVAVFPDIQAPEIVRDDGRWYIIRVSGGPHAAPAAPADHGWLELAELHMPDPSE